MENRRGLGRKRTGGLRLFENITKDSFTFNGLNGRDRRKGKLSTRFESLPQDQQIAETALSAGVFPILCLLGLMACSIFLFKSWRKRNQKSTQPLPIVIALCDSVYLVLTLIDRIDRLLALHTCIVEEGIPRNIKSHLITVASTFLYLANLNLCIHSVEVSFAVLVPLHVQRIWTKKRRFIIALVTCSIFTLFMVAGYVVNAHIVHLGIDPVLFYSIYNPVYITVLDVLPICITSVSFALVIIGHRKQSKKMQQTSNSDNMMKNNAKITRLLLTSVAVYFIIGVPIEILKILFLSTDILKFQDFYFWLIKVIRKTMEVMYGSTLMCVFVLNDVNIRKYCKREQPVSCPRQTTQINLASQSASR